MPRFIASSLMKSCLLPYLRATALLTVVLLGTGTQSVSAQGVDAQEVDAQMIEVQDLPPLPIEFNPDGLINPGRPGGRQRGGGSRGSCQRELPLSAIAYTSVRSVEELGETRMVESVGSLTTQSRPILWFYLPAPVQETAAELVIQDSQAQVVFQGPLVGETESDGIVGIELETDLPVAVPHQWFLTIDCDETERVTVNGWVEHRAIDPDAMRTLAQASPQNRVALFAEYGFGQDAVSALAKLRFFDLEDETVAQEWTQMLASMGLSDLSDAPILPCCLVSSEMPTELEDVEEEVPIPSDTMETEEEIPEEDVEEDSEEEETEEEDNRTILQRARDRG